MMSQSSEGTLSLSLTPVDFPMEWFLPEAGQKSEERTVSESR